MNPDVYDVEYALQFVKPFGCKVAVDVGANHGETTVLLWKHGFDVIAVEPNKALYDQLANLGPRVTAVSVAASDSEREVEMYVMRDDGLNTLERDWAWNVFPGVWTGDKVTVDAKPLATIFKQAGINDVAFVKIDAEGHDHEALVGLFKGPIRPQVIMFEANELMPEKAFDCLLRMREAGYSRFSIFIRAGTELLHMERWAGDCLPEGWERSKGSRFYANIIGRR